METKEQLKVEYADTVRQMSADVEEEQRVRAELQEKQSKLQQQANSDSQMAEALLRPILKRHGELDKRKTEIDGVLKFLEKAAKEAAKPSTDGQPPKEQNG